MLAVSLVAPVSLGGEDDVHDTFYGFCQVSTVVCVPKDLGEAC